MAFVIEKYSMRISSDQAQLIAQNIHHHLGESARMWLFGSRVDDQKRGGDVDLYVEADSHTLISELRCKLQLEECLEMPVDLIVHTHDENTAISRIAKKTGIAL